MGRKKLPKSEHAHKLPLINKLPTPSKTVHDRVRWGLVYDPPKELEFCWKTGGKSPCPDCFVGSTMILNPNGLMHLQDFNGHEIITQDGLKHTRGLLKRRPQEIIKLTMMHGYEIETTLNQEMLALNQSSLRWSQISNLKPGHWLALKRGSLFHLPEDKSAESVGELIGYIAGDGSFNRETRHLSISFGIQSEKTADYIFQNWLDFFGRGVWLAKNSKQFEISARASKYFEYLATVGIYKSKFDLPLSNTRSFYFGYLRGLFMSDGCIDQTGTQITLSSVNRRFLSQTQNILLACGVLSSLSLSIERSSAVILGKKCAAKNLFKLKILGGTNLEHFMKLIGFFPGSEKEGRFILPGPNGNQGVYFPIREPTFKSADNSNITGKFLTLYELKRYRKKILNTLSVIDQYLEQDLIMLQIQQIERVGRQNVYDVVDVEETASFLANNFIVHNCLYLESLSWQPLSRFPTYPREPKTMCAIKDPTRCRCQMLVRFPWGKTYTLLPLQDMAFYKDRDVLSVLENREIEKNPNFIAEKIGGVVNACVDFFKKKIDRIQALVWDFQRMDKFDKAFMVFAGEPLVVDIQQAWVQATKEAALYKSLDWRKQYLIETLTRSELDDFHELVNRNFDRLMHTGQMQEAMERTDFWQKFVEEIAVSALFGKVSGEFFDALKLGIQKIGKTIGGWRNQKIIDKALEEAVRKAEKVRQLEHAKYIDDIVADTSDFVDSVKTLAGLPPEQWYHMLMNEVDLFTTFWKDCVLIYRPAAAVRNAMDNTLKAINEMLNSVVRGKPFWAFQSERGLKIIRVEKGIFSTTFGEQAKGLSAGGYNWLSNLRDTLYENLLVRPEQWARKGVYCGKLRAFEKNVLDKLACNPDDLADLVRLEKEVAMKEVNRIFFDYSKRLSKSRVVNNVFPFFDYNMKNVGYWLHDFAHNPWKLKAVIEIWDFWCEESGRNADFKIVNTLPLYVIPGIYFDPFQYTSARQIISVFSKAVGAKPKWLEASNRHYERLYKLLQGTPQLGPRLQANKGFREWVRFRGHRFRYDVINYVDKFLGVSPLVRKGLEALLIAEPEPWRKMFPQSDLIGAISKVMIDSWRREALAKIRTVDINKEMKWQKSRGEVPDAERARETLVNWSATRDIIGFTWGSYLTRHYQSVHDGWKGVVADSQGSK